MATITAAMVKDLRESTGAGMMDCKAALTENGGDMQAAQDWLRKKGLSKAAKKAGRVAAEGLIGAVTKGNKGVLVEVNSETDFVARNEQFQGLVKMIAQVALKAGADVEKIKAAPVGDLTVERAIQDAIATIGENMTLRRAASLEVGQGVVSSYVHNAVIEGAGKIGVIVALESAGKTDELALLGRQLAMHVAAAKPQALDPAGLDPELVKREKDVLADKYRQQGKAENVIEKIVEFRPEDLLQGSLPAGSGLHPRQRQVGRSGGEGSRGQDRRSDQDCRLRELCARRGHREAGIRFRSRSCGGQRTEEAAGRDRGVSGNCNRQRGSDSKMAEPVYRRVVIKLSGEYLAGQQSFGLDQPTVDRIADDLIAARQLGTEIAVVVGGGNMVRGVQVSSHGVSRTTGDTMGMLATMMNCLALEAAIERKGTSARTLSAFVMPEISELFTRAAAHKYLAEGRIVLLGGGTGNPFFTTDTTAVLRAAEIGAEAVLKATNVDGVYSADPKKDPTAKRFDRLTHSQAIEGGYKVMDATAFALARETSLPIIVFSIAEPGSIGAILRGTGHGTVVAG